MKSQGLNTITMQIRGFGSGSPSSDPGSPGTAADKLSTAKDFTSTDGILEYHPITVVSLTGHTVHG